MPHELNGHPRECSGLLRGVIIYNNKRTSGEESWPNIKIKLVTETEKNK